MRFKLPFNVANQEPDEDFVRFVSQVFTLINTILNGEVGLVDNCKTSLLTVTFVNANVQQAIPHGLGKLPNGYITVGSHGNGIVSDGSGSATAQYMYLQCSTAEKKKLLIF